MLALLLLVSLVASASAGNREFQHDSASYRDALADAKKELVDYGRAARLMIDQCKDNRQLEHDNPDAAENEWPLTENHAERLQNAYGHEAVTKVKLLRSAIRDFAPFRGPGSLNKHGQHGFAVDVGDLVDGSDPFYDAIEKLHDSFDEVKAHRCDVAEIKVQTAETLRQLGVHRMGRRYERLVEWARIALRH
jgi:hypothetical protein